MWSAASYVNPESSGDLQKKIKSYFINLVKPCNDLEVLAVTSKTSLPVIIQESHGKAILMLSTVAELISSISVSQLVICK